VADTFRIGSIGQLFEDDMFALAGAVKEVLDEMGVALRAA
jgi:aspartate aminotransferase-like enzyme